jgi:hypothetical protein
MKTGSKSKQSISIPPKITTFFLSEDNSSVFTPWLLDVVIAVEVRILKKKRMPTKKKIKLGKTIMMNIDPDVC